MEGFILDNFNPAFYIHVYNLKLWFLFFKFGTIFICFWKKRKRPSFLNLRFLILDNVYKANNLKYKMSHTGTH